MDLIDTVYANSIDLYAQVKQLINLGVDVNFITEYNESALRVTSKNGRFDVVELLLNAGANQSQLKWTSTIFEVVFGTPKSLKKKVQTSKELESKDYWSRTPFLFAVQLGNIAKAELLLAFGVNRKAVGHCGKTAMQYAIQQNHLSMLKWLLDQGFDIEAQDEFLNTPLLTAAELGKTNCFQLLIDYGANIHHAGYNGKCPIQIASTIEIVQILLSYGQDVQEISPEMHAVLLGVHYEIDPVVSKEDYLTGKRPQFGQHNPEQMEIPFWFAMIRAGASAFRARNMFSQSVERHPVWSYQRFGRSTTLLNDGRILEIAGEHEDDYDSDFWIYNDVTLFEGNGKIRIFCYPEKIFPPTDFHSATQVGDFIYIIGNLGYRNARQPHYTPVYRLNIQSFVIDKVETKGEIPGWISKHTAYSTVDGKIIIKGGRKIVLENGKTHYRDNTEQYQLDLKSFLWTRYDASLQPLTGLSIKE